MKDQVLIERFLKQNPLREISAARFEYSLVLNPNLEYTLSKVLHEKGMETDDMRRDRDQIQNETDPEELLRWMGRDMVVQTRRFYAESCWKWKMWSCRLFSTKY